MTLRPGSGLTEHTMIYGATGSGKTRGFVKPFILQTARRKESMVLVDPKGEIYESMSAFLKEEGYEVRMFNLLDMENSDAWNCLSEIEHDKDLVQSIAEVIIKNTSNANERQDFWEKAELNLLMALMHYVASQTVPGTKELLPIQQRSLGAIYRMLSNESFADLERRFEALPKGHPALPPYGIFKLANRQIWGNIAIGLGNRLSVFQNPLVDKITSYNEIDLTLPGKKSNTQRALMLPDEILRMDNRECLVLLRGEKPLRLYKIIPDEHPSFGRLRDVRVAEYIPHWRQEEAKPSAPVQPAAPPEENAPPEPAPEQSEPVPRHDLPAAEQAGRMAQYDYGLLDPEISGFDSPAQEPGQDAPYGALDLIETLPQDVGGERKEEGQL